VIALAALAVAWFVFVRTRGLVAASRKRHDDADAATEPTARGAAPEEERELASKQAD
jgi:hypothetical protein